MTKEGRDAAELATSIEARLSGVSKAHTKTLGHYARVTFEVLASDLEGSAQIWSAPLGSRFALALVGINDDETPVKGPQKHTQRHWHEMDRTTKAGIRCGEAVFHAYLKEEYLPQWRQLPVEDISEQAAYAVRLICKVKSRRELDGEMAAILWDELDSKYVAWREVG